MVESPASRKLLLGPDDFLLDVVVLPGLGLVVEISGTALVVLSGLCWVLLLLG